MEKILVSACLLGENCRYSGENYPCKEIEQLKQQYELIPVCPEVLGGLSIPRDPVELKDGRAITKNGIDVTEQFQLGAKKTLDIARKKKCGRAILKSKSPSCGCGLIYDGSFTNKLIPGKGMAAELLLKENIQVTDENRILMIF